MPLKNLLFGFEGRIRRRDWWLWGIGMGLVWMVAYAALGGLLFGPVWAGAQFNGASTAGGWPMTAFGLATFLPLLWVQIALAAKRAHDRNHEALIPVGLTVLSGLLSFVPEVFDLITDSSLTDGQFNTLSTTVTVGTGAMNLYLLVVLGFLDGTRGPNRFGRSPKGIGGEPADRAAEVFS